MATNQSATAYRMAAASGATHLGLLVLVYDALAADLQRAAAAIQRGSISERCGASNHALALLGHLESWTRLMDSPGLSESLDHFYAYLRAQILSLQRGSTAEDFFILSELVSTMRSTWQQKEAMLLEQLTTQARPDPRAVVPEIVASTRGPAYAWSA